MTRRLLPIDDAALAPMPPPGDGVTGRTLLQVRVIAGRGRSVERVTLRSGRTVIVKARNDRTDDREALFYRHVLFRAGELVPAYLASAAVGGIHLLALEDVGGRHVMDDNPGDRDRAMAALARFHRCFTGAGVADVLGASAYAALGAEATPDPIEQVELLTAYQTAVARLSSAVSAPTVRRLDRVAERVAAAIASSPLVLDPGDVRPENVLIAGERTMLLDFENVAVRRLGLAVAAMLEHWPEPASLVRRYWMHVGGMAFGDPGRSIRAGRLWLAVRDRSASLPVGGQAQYGKALNDVREQDGGR